MSALFFLPPLPTPSFYILRVAVRAQPQKKRKALRSPPDAPLDKLADDKQNSQKPMDFNHISQ